MTSSPPAPDVRIEITEPTASELSTEDYFCCVLDSHEASAEEVATVLEGATEAELFCRSNRNAVVMRVDLHNGRAQRLTVWRGLFSTSECYYAVRPDGSVWISDHFRNVLAWLPPAERPPDDLGLAEHYLFRKPYGHTSYSAAVRRVGHGEVLTFDLTAGDLRVGLFDRIDEPVVDRPAEEHLNLVDEELAAVLAAVADDGTTGVMFSGGVDSTLLMAYLRDVAQPVTFVPDAPEFSQETAYARNAARELGISLMEIPMEEASFVDMLERTTDVAAIPIFDDAKPYLARTILDSPFSRLVPGQGADTSFGTSLRLTRFSSWFRWPGIFQLVEATGRYAPGHLGYRLRQVVSRAEGFRHEPLDPLGYAGTTRAHGDTSIFRAIADSAVLEEAHRGSLQYVLDRLERRADPASRFFSHLELSHWLLTFGNPVVTDRLVAQSAGKGLILPYVAGRVLTAMASIPVSDRYVRGLQAKWILKGLLARKVPAYPIDQRKKATALPWERFYRSGPLEGFWERYDVPDLFVGEAKDAIVNSQTAATWNAMSHAVWLERVARNRELAGHPTHLSARFALDHAP